MIYTIYFINIYIYIYQYIHIYMYIYIYIYIAKISRQRILYNKGPRICPCGTPINFPPKNYTLD